MRKVLAFGAGNGFVRDYAAYFKRHGFELGSFIRRHGRPGKHDGGAVLLVSQAMSPGEEEDLGSVLAYDRRQPVIFMDGEGPQADGRLKKIRDRAKYVLPRGFLKKDLLSALKGCSALLALDEEVDRLKGELKVRMDELSLVLDVGRALASSFELSKVLGKIMERMRSTIGAEAWVVFLMDEENIELVFEASSGPGKPKKTRIKPDDGIAGWAAVDKTTRLVNNVSKEARYSKAVDRSAGVKTRSVMAVPILSKGRLLGVMELINKETDEGFSTRDLELATRLIDQTAIAIERGEMYKKMADLVITDDLTKLFNLRYLDRTLEVEIERAMRYGLSVTLIFMDIDYFKRVNDRHGHLVGSKLLVEVSQLMLKNLRRVDIVARYGGDEFVVVLPQTDVPAAKVIAERLRKSIEKQVFLKSENLALRLTASFGIASYPQHADSKEELMRLADEAMYRVKYLTRNDVYVVRT